MKTAAIRTFWRLSQPLILASASSARQHILREAGVPFEAVPADLDERAIEANMASREPDAIARALSHAKAAAVGVGAPGRLVLGADQVASCEGRLFGKPASIAAAADLLRFLSGRRHRLHSAVVLLRDRHCILETVAHADMEMRVLSEHFIASYLEAVGPRALSSAGAYQVEGAGAHLFAAIVGDQWTIMGLPLLPVLESLRREGALDA